MEEKDSNKIQARRKLIEQSGVISEFGEEAFKISLAQITNVSDSEIIGGHWSFFAFKNPTSFAIGTSGNGMKVIENSKLIHSVPFPTGVLADLLDIIYIEQLDCYLLNYNDNIYRKDIDDKPPYLYMDINSNWRVRKFFRYSKVNQRLFVISSAKLKVINLLRKQVEIEIRINREESEFVDFRLLGLKEKKLFYLTVKGNIKMCSLSYDLKKICTRTNFKIQPFEGRREIWRYITVCDKSKYLFVHSSEQYSSKSSRMMVLEVKERSLVPLAEINEFQLNTRLKSTLGFWRYIGEHILWAAPNKLEGSIHIYDFNTESGELKELTDEKRVKHEEFYVYKLSRLEDRLYYAGNRGEIMELSLVSGVQI